MNTSIITTKANDSKKSQSLKIALRCGDNMNPKVSTKKRMQSMETRNIEVVQNVR